MEDINWTKVEAISLAVLAFQVVTHGIYWVLKEGPRKRHAANEEARLEREENFSNLSDKFRAAHSWLAEQTKDQEFPREGDISMSDIVDKLNSAQKLIFYKNLVSLLEESFILFYEPSDPEYARMWNTWDDYMNEFLALPGFKEMLPDLLSGEDSAFSQYIMAKIKSVSHLPPEAEAIAGLG